MRQILILFVGFIILWGCSATNENINRSNFSSDSNSVQKAQEFFIQGSLEEFNGDYKKAISYYERALELDPSAGIYFTLSKNYLMLNKLSQALVNAKSAVRLDSLNQEYLMQLGTIYFISRQTDSAATCFNKIVSLDSTNYQAYFYLGQSLEEKKPSEALKVYEKLLNKTGAEWDILLRVVDLNSRIGNEEKTIETIQNLIKLDPSNLQLQKFLIESYLNSGKFQSAIKIIDENLISFPEDVELIEYKAKVLFSLDSTDASVNEYLKLIENDKINYGKKFVIATAFMNEVSKDSSLIPSAIKIITAIEKDTVDWELDSYMADLSQAQKNDSLAIYYLDRAARNAEWNSQIHVRLGFLLFKNRRYNELVERLSVSAEKFPDNFFINFFVGLGYNQLNKYSNAFPYFQKCVQINPNDVDGLHSLGYTLHQLKRGREAIPHLKDALRIQPNNIDLLSTLALVYENLKEWKTSDSLYENILIRSPDNALILNNYAYSLSERDDSLEYAFEMSKKSLSIEPENASYLDTFGWILYKLNKLDEAVDYIRRAIEKENDNSTLYDHLGDVYYKLGANQKAIEAWQNALKLDASRVEIENKINKVKND